MKVAAIALLALVAGLPARSEDAPPQAASDAEGVEFFEKRIRPVLVDKCYSCHSPQAKALKGGLRLDTREMLLKGGDSGPAIVPGKPEASLLIKAVRARDEELKMPPKERDRLSASQLADFEAWIKRGAPDPRTGKPEAAPDLSKARAHWAFQKPKDPPVPAVKQKDWVRNPIDAFVLAKLEEKGMKPQAPVDRRTLLRRLSFDLVGLPPTPAEIDAFEKDAAPDALEKVIDRLLASPQYGERWGRHWLDVARYSDTKGYVFQEERRYPFAYTYRDWVIRALNEDLPYDQFLVQQIAADRLPLGDDKRPLAAMGFLTLGRRFLNRLPDIIDDRIDTLTRGMMAFTVSCARCHDHKFDPIPTKDYYSVYAVFASSTEPKDPPLIGTLQKTADNAAYDQELGKRQAESSKFREEKHREILASLRTAGQVAKYLVAAHEGRAMTKEEEFRGLAQKHDLRGPVLERWVKHLAKKDAIFAHWRAAAGNAEAKGGHELVAKAFEKPAASVAEAAERYGALLTRADLPDDLKAVLHGKDGPLAIPLAEIDKAFNRAERDKLRALDKKVEELRATHPGAPQHAMALQDGGVQEGRVFIRGNPNNIGETVPRQFFEVLTEGKRQPFKEGSGRLELARAIASPENPLTARVFVNRVWLQHFGAGLVRTPSDFGVRSDPPTHPELLDWLARRFSGDLQWSVKKLHKLILTSATYRQGSADHPKYRESDPDNRLLWKVNRRRLEFEPMRDSILAVAGRLDLTVGGKPVPLVSNPTVKQKQNAETITNDTAGADPTQDLHATRRAVYLFIDRQNLPNTFRDFDFASPDTHSPQRYETSVPQQALFLMNSPFVVEQARYLARRPELADPATRIEVLYRILYGRKPTADEAALGRKFLAAGLPDPVAKTSAWSYGVGQVDEAERKVKSFAPLPHYTGRAWQGGPQLPDAKLGWVLLTAEGGHPGSQAHGAAIRRWTAPRDGTVSVSGTLAHRSADGDGVRARILSSRDGEIASWVAHRTEAQTEISRIEVRKGDVLDFVVDCRKDENSDNFTWPPVVRMTPEPVATAGSVPMEWSAAAEFGSGTGKPSRVLSTWEAYVQVLLLANEFFFVD